MALAPMEFRHRRLDWSRVYLVGVLNVTPDSFSDGGLYTSLDAAVARGVELARQGADIIDIGGESTRPGAGAVDQATEIERVVPVIRRLAAEVEVPLSVDTTKAEVARQALAAGAEIVNDVSGGLFDPAIPSVAADTGAAYICGHVRGHTLAEVHAGQAAPPSYEDVAADLADRLAALPLALRPRTIADPCLGFGKDLPRNLDLVRRAGELAGALGCPVMIGPSRKRFIRTLVHADALPPGSRLAALDSGTMGACLFAVSAGAHLLRVHNIELFKPALMVYEAIRGASS